jgi:hypothetical protein
MSRDIAAISEKQLQRINTNVFLRYSREGSIFSMSCSTGEFLLHYLKVLTAITDHRAEATFTDCYPCRGTVVRGPVSCPQGRRSQSNREWSTVYFSEPTVDNDWEMRLRKWSLSALTSHSISIVVHETHEMTEFHSVCCRKNTRPASQKEESISVQQLGICILS